MNKPRNKIISSILSALLCGFGQIYNGQVIKGFLFFTSIIVAELSFGYFRWVTTFLGLVLLIIIVIFLKLASIIDAAIVSNKLKNYTLKFYNHWIYYVIIAILFLGIRMGIYPIEKLNIGNYVVSTADLDPSLKMGDRLIADKIAYTNKKVNYGDIITCKIRDNVVRIFRVVGLPNDTIQFKENQLYINGKVRETQIQKEPNENNLFEYLEELPNGFTYKISKKEKPIKSNVTNTKELVVPDDKYYVLGDNREASIDSRLFGPIKKELITGRVIYTYWGNPLRRINIDLRNSLSE